MLQIQLTETMCSHLAAPFLSMTCNGRRRRRDHDRELTMCVWFFALSVSLFTFTFTSTDLLLLLLQQHQARQQGKVKHPTSILLSSTHPSIRLVAVY